jgi:hypothetical protein
MLLQLEHVEDGGVFDPAQLVQRDQTLSMGSMRFEDLRRAE